MTEPVEVPGTGEAGGTSAYDQHLLTAGRGRWRRQPAAGQRLVAKETLDGVDRDRFIHLPAVASALAGVIADPAMNGGQGVLFDQGLPGSLKTAGLRQREPGLDIFSSRAGVIAGWQGRPPDG